MTPELLAEIQRTLKSSYDGTDGLREDQKRDTIMEYAAKYGCRMFIETGTNRGDTVEAVREFFDEVYSIEIGPNLCEAAQRRFADIRNVQIVPGDARDVLKGLITWRNVLTPEKKVIFYLDAHCQYDDDSPEGKALGTSVPVELYIIRKTRPNSVVLIDDARLFQPVPDDNPYNVSGAWPGLEEMLRDVETWGIWDVDLKDDLIRLVPKS